MARRDAGHRQLPRPDAARLRADRARAHDAGPRRDRPSLQGDACARASRTRRWASAPPIVKQAAVGAALQTVDDYARASAAAGGFDRGEAHLSRTNLRLDAKGWEAAAKACEKLLGELNRIEEAAAEAAREGSARRRHQRRRGRAAPVRGGQAERGRRRRRRGEAKAPRRARAPGRSSASIERSFVTVKVEALADLACRRSPRRRAPGLRRPADRRPAARGPAPAARAALPRGRAALRQPADGADRRASPAARWR